ncbi:flagellar protein FliT [Bacillus sp. FSL K6-3431]|uniref:flagellar protein FliT n=1 Tax=Bacillus sp. FSL K6-3431 TaxID=2921500 RepID=UPI0030F97D59
MKKQLETCVFITLQLIELAKTVNHVDRDTVIFQIEELMQKREEILPTIQGPFSPQENKIGKQILKLNKELDPLLANIRIHIKKDLNQLEQKRASATRYSNPYASMQEFDGAFYDKRK